MLWRKSAPAASCACYSHAGEASACSPGHCNPFLSFPGSQLGQGRAQGAECWGCPVAAPSSSRGALCQHPTTVPLLPWQRLGLCTSASCTQLLNSDSENLSFWNFSSPWNIPSQLPAPRISCCHPCWTPLCRTPTAVTKLLLVQSACLSGKICI